MKLFGRRQPRRRFIKNVPAGSIVFARHTIPGLMDSVPGGTRGTLLTWIHRDPDVAVVVEWDGVGRRDARGTDLSPHFEPGGPRTVAKKQPAEAAAARPPLRPGERRVVVEEIVTTEPWDPSKSR